MSEERKESICSICNDVVDPKDKRARSINGALYHNGNRDKFLKGFYETHRKVSIFSTESELRDYNPEAEEKEMEKYSLSLPPYERPCFSIAVLSLAAQQLTKH